MSLFDEMMKNPKYRELFEKLPNDEKAVLIDSVKKLVDQVEAAIIIPIEKTKSQ